MLDFTSALYLGLKHPAESLPSWSSLTLGKPAALAELEETGDLEHDLARLVQCERVVVSSSTLHLFWDLFSVFARRRTNIFADEGLYPIARWGIERAAGSGIRTFGFRHYDTGSLRTAISAAPEGEAIVVADGLCPACGRLAPLADFAECARQAGGLVVIDDTQGLGIIGRDPQPSAPYGTGGGGSLSRLPQVGPVAIVCSMAKAFGVPLAFLGGTHTLVSRFRAASATRVHSSPPAAPILLAARRALAINRRQGDRLRASLAAGVTAFQRGLAGMGVDGTPGRFPVQSVIPPLGSSVNTIFGRLLRAGIRPVRQASCFEAPRRVSFIVTARHTATEIGRALDALEEALMPENIRRIERSSQL